LRSVGVEISHRYETPYDSDRDQYDLDLSQPAIERRDLRRR
jgi:hypothetical protein